MLPSSSVLLAFAMLLIVQPITAQNPNDYLVGIWEPADKEKRVVVEVFESSDGKINGKIIGAYDARGNYMAAPESKAPMLIDGFKYTHKGTWKNGRITDPEDGKDYCGRITMLAQDKLEVRAYSGILWKDMEWVKVTSSASAFASVK